MYEQFNPKLSTVMRCFLHDINVVVGLFHLLVYLPEEDATVFAEVQGVAILLLHWVMLL